MREKTKKIGTVLSKVLLAMLVFSMNLTPVLAEDTDIPVQSENVLIATQWNQVQNLIDNASENAIIDITALCLTKPNITLNITKDITIKCQPTSDDFYEIAITDLFFEIKNGAVLTLENVPIDNTQLNKSVISGTGDAIISKSILEPSTAQGTGTIYNAPATIDLVGDVTVETDGDFNSCIVAGATILDREGVHTGKAGTAIKAINVTVNGGYVVGGSSFESGCDSGDGIIASGNVTVIGVRNSEDSNALVKCGIVFGPNTDNTTVGMPIRFTESSQIQRVLLLQDADVLGNDRSTVGFASPYTIEMSEMDIAIIDNSKIGWYTDIPLFSEGFYCITNPVASWGTLDYVTEVYPITATKATLLGTKKVMIEDDINHYAAAHIMITITANAATGNKKFSEWSISPESVVLGSKTSATTTFTMPAEAVEVIANYIEQSQPSTPSSSKPIVSGSNEEGNVIVDEVKTSQEIKDVIESKDIITTFKVTENVENANISVKVGRKYVNQDVYVLQMNKEKNELELVSITKVDDKGVASFTTSSKEAMTMTTMLPVGFIDTMSTSDNPSLTYFIDENHTFKRGWVYEESEGWYFMDYKTAIKQNDRWIADGQDSNALAKWYCLDKNGVMMQSSWIANDVSGSKWYYVDSTGLFVRNTVVDGYLINAEGYWTK